MRDLPWAGFAMATFIVVLVLWAGWKTRRKQ